MVLIWVFLFCISGESQNLNVYQFKKGDTFQYKRTIVTNDEDSSIDMYQSVIKQVYCLSQDRTLLEISNFFPTGKILEKKPTILLIDYHTLKMYINLPVLEQDDKMINILWDKIKNNSYLLIDSIIKFEEYNNINIINGDTIKNDEKIIFYPLINYSDMNLVDENNVGTLGLLYYLFPELIKINKDLKTFYMSAREGGEETTINRFFLISEYLYYPNLGDVLMYKYELQ